MIRRVFPYHVVLIERVPRESARVSPRHPPWVVLGDASFGGSSVSCRRQSWIARHGRHYAAAFPFNDHGVFLAVLELRIVEHGRGRPVWVTYRTERTRHDRTSDYCVCFGSPEIT
jgi:hypothetical protein